MVRNNSRLRAGARLFMLSGKEQMSKCIRPAIALAVRHIQDASSSDA